ncbi:MAG TPA: hypothetical protein VK549_18650, partial [Acidimicrobiia bacterium]|nr:hypothetical protein [Acidimicrobiia bacterium]
GILHFFVVPAIVDLAGLQDDGSDHTGSVHDEALALRDLFKFEFFFAEKGEFLAEVDAEVAATDRPVTAPFLRPFLEAYWATAEALAVHDDAPVGAAALADEACGLAEQFLLQARIYSADAVSSSYIDGAVRLAEHRGLLEGDLLEAELLDGGADFAARRAEFAHELHTWVRRVRVMQARAAARFLELMRS